MTNKFAIAIPTYNEIENIKQLIPALYELHQEIEIFVIDDNSPDGTAEIVEKLTGQYPNLTLFKRPGKQGLAAAYLDAFARIIPNENIDYIVTMDADFSHDPKDLSKLLDATVDYDLVVGSRYIAGGKIENWNLWRRNLSKFGNFYAGFITGVPIADLTAGFVIYSRKLLEQILKNGVKSEGYAYQIEMKYLAHKYGAKMTEVPITFRERGAGTSKLNNGVILEGVLTPWYLRLFR